MRSVVRRKKTSHCNSRARFTRKAPTNKNVSDLIQFQSHEKLFTVFAQTISFTDVLIVQNG